MEGPRLARLLAVALLPRTEREFIVGDLEELFGWRVARYGRWRATLLYVCDVIVSVISRRRPRWHAKAQPYSPAQRASIMKGLLGDARAAARTLRREPGFTGLAIFTLALGIGSTAAVFGMINQLILRPLPGVAASDDIAYLRFHSATDPESREVHGLTTLDFDVLRREASLLEGIASYGLSTLTVKLDGARPIAVTANTVYGDFFEVLGVRPAEGRMLAAPETDLLANPLVAVISESLRASLFANVNDVVGQTIQLNGQSVAILGVAGGGFSGPERGIEIDLWFPYPALVPLIGFDPERLRSPESTMHDELVVRLRSGVSLEAAEAQLDAILTRLGRGTVEHGEYVENLRPAFYRGLHIDPMWRERVYASLRVLAGVVILVLVIACANVANLLLVRNVKRRASLAMRRALGASIGRLARHHLVESLFLAVPGTIAGLIIAWFIAVAFRGERLARMPAFEGLALDWHVLLFAAAASAGTAALFGTLPALLAGRFDLGAALKAAGQRDTGRLASVRLVLSAGQIALSIALLVGGVLLTRTVRNLYAVETGIDIENVFALPIDKPDGMQGAALDAWHRDVIDRLNRIPGVAGVALDMYGPHGSRMMGRLRQPGTPPAEATRTTVVPVTPGWFELFGVRPASGRTFEPQDWNPNAPGKALVTASLARRVFGTPDVVGRRVLSGSGDADELEIVGVLEDVRMAYAPDEPHDALFVSYDAAPPLPFMTVLIRTTQRNAALIPEIRIAVEAILPDKAVADPTPLTDRVDTIHSERRIFSRLLGLLSALAVLLAAVGLYGVIAFNVAGRRREFGIRLAIGAQPGRIGTLVARYAARIIGPGIALGFIGAYAFSRILESRLFGVAPTDGASYVLGAVLFSTVAAFACLAPMRTALRVNPLIILKEE
jgi:predicted permease